jgi:trimeric autotransporter adhesin
VLIPAQRLRFSFCFKNPSYTPLFMFRNIFSCLLVVAVNDTGKKDRCRNIFLLFFGLLIFCLPVSTDAQNISTIAGNGSSVYSGDGGPATAAGIYFDLGVAADGAGNVFIACWGENRVRKVDPLGIITTYAGNGTLGYSGDGGPATAALLSGPMQVCTDASGNVYLSDYYNHRIRKISTSGIITTVAGNGIGGYSGDGGQATAAEIQFPWGIVVDASGNLFIGDYYNHRIRKVDGAGIITTYAGTGIPGFSGDGGAATAAQFYYTTGLAIDGSGNLYIADYVNQRVRKVNTSGIISTIAGTGVFGYGGDGGAATAAMLNDPLGVAADYAGNVYVSDFGNSRIRKITTSGIISTFAGTGVSGFSGDGGPATSAQLFLPYTVALDANGNILIADSYNYRLRKVNNGNSIPYFTGGLSQNLTVCQNSSLNPINSLLAVIDTDIGQLETWSLLSGPFHGTAVASDTTISTGGTVLPAGLSYSPTVGYSGNDTFKVTVNDGTAFDTITIYVTVNPAPSAITGGTGIFIGTYATLGDATTGGTWSSSNIAVATVGSTTGFVTGTGTGVVTISYTLLTGCFVTTTLNVSPYAGQIITTIAGNGTPGFGGDGSAATAANLNQPWGVAVDAAGNVYIADELNNRIRKVNTSGVISTIAGTGSAGFGGDGFAATSALLNHPYDVIVDASGNVYVADAGNNRIRKINTSGVISTIAGNGLTVFGGDGGPATAAGLWGPSGIAMDASGNLFICADGTRVRKVNTSGVISTFAGNGTVGFSGDGLPATAAQLHNPVSVAVDPSGNVLIADQLNRYIRKVNTSGIISSVAGNGTLGYSGDGGLANSAALNDPWGIITDAVGNIFIGDHGNNRVRRVNSSSIINTVAGNGVAGYSGDQCAATSGQINTHWGICTDASGNIYIADGGNHRVRKISYNHAPAFVGGHSLSLTVCQDSPGDSINTLLAVADIDQAQGETWSVITTALHGTLVVSYTTTSNGGTLTPTGLYYRPNTGYSGLDSFKIQVADCGIGYDTTVVHVIVNPPPSAISGTPTVCPGNTTTLTVLVGVGTWTSSNTAVATVGSSTGVVTGVSAGTSIITFSPGVGCSVTKTVTVNPLPSMIAGASSVCVGLTTTLTDTLTGGTWSSSNIGVATIGSGTGVVTGGAPGVVGIVYTLPTGCTRTKLMTVNAVPSAISGLTSLCVGSTSLLSSPGGGTWLSGNPAIATVNLTTGVVTGISPGTALITYSLGLGCSVGITVTVNALPSAISGIATICVGLTSTLTDASPGGVWSVPGFGLFASVDSFTGVVTGLSPGTEAILYTLGTGCATTIAVTVSSMPGAISGTTTVCVGGTNSLFDAGGGTWTSSNPAVATVGSISGLVNGISAGMATISYTIIVGCPATVVETVNPLPVTITGASSVCVGLTTTESDASPGGTWTSSNLTVATIGGTTGVVSGLSPGTTIITYTLPTGCSVNRTITVNTSPGIIGGATQGCVGTTALLTNIVSGGTWSSSNIAVATIGSSSGLVGCLSPGITTITYSLGIGCAVTSFFTVNPLPAVITGTTGICVGSSTTLSDMTIGGTWTSGSPIVATIGSLSGIVTGVGLGTSLITYSLGTGCSKTILVTINPLPAVIAGPATVCAGSSEMLTDITPGGTWSSIPVAIATVGSLTGTVTGVSPGTATITYSLSTGCSQTKAITVNPLPAAIGGPGAVCVGSYITLTDMTAGGAWSTAAITATVGPTTGLVTGVSAGTAVISYTIGTGCAQIKTVTINPLPSAITGPTAVCVGATIALTDPDPGGTWISGLPAVATIGSSSGIVTGITTSSTPITYTLPTGCATNTTVTVSLSPGPISGAAVVCAGANLILSDIVPGGAWNSSNMLVATIGSLTGVVTGVSAGTATITYSLGTGCMVYKTITVNAAPATIAGATSICVGGTTTLSDVSPGGAWNSMSPAVATVSGLGVVAGISAGTSVISYTMPVTGCAATVTITVNPVPLAISGIMHLCVGSTTTLTDAVSGGTWSIVPIAIATIGSSTGVVTGITPGTATVTYSLGSGCTISSSFTVNPLPLPIGGTPQVCVGSTTHLTDATPGGSWISSNSAVATVAPGTGIVTGITAGTATISYTVGSGCATTVIITVNPLPPAITGAGGICAGLTTTLSDAAPGGTWSSSNPAVAIIGTSSGVISALGAGTSIISYTLPTGCATSTSFAVNAAPASITGIASMCIGASSTLSDVTPGGTWSSTDPVVATIGSTGIVTSVSIGNATISYSAGGCAATVVVTVNSLPGAISGVPVVCVGATTTLSDLPAGGTWSSTTPAIATVGSTSGIVTGVSAGAGIITYSLGVGCTVATTITVNPLPDGIAGAAHICLGSTTTLSDATPGGVWSSGNTAIATIGTSGVVSGVSNGIATISYTIGTGCSATLPMNVISVPAITVPDMCAWYDTITVHNADTTGSYTSFSATVTNLGGGNALVMSHAPGTAILYYTVPTGCIATKTFTVNPLPAPITGNTQLCIGLTTTLSNISTGGAWSSGNILVAAVGSATGVVTGMSAGATRITYTLPTGCKTDTTVAVHSLPSVISGADFVCAGSTTLYSDTASGGTWSSSNTAVATAGTSGVIFGVASGNAMITYTLGAACMAARSISVKPLPATYAITGGGSYCAGGVGLDLGLSGSDTGVSYQLFNGSSPVGSAMTGTGSALDHGMETAAGDYKFIATNTGSSCTANMMDSATIVVIPTVIPSVALTSTMGDTLCAGTASTFNTSVVNGGSSPVYQWEVNGVNTGVLSASYSYTPANGDVVKVIVSSNAACALPDTASDNIAMTVEQVLIPVVVISSSPGTNIGAGVSDTFTAVVTNAGTSPAYQWTINSVAVAGATNLMFVSSELSNQDTVGCAVTSNGFCGGQTKSNSVVITVYGVGVAATNKQTAVKVLPNPNKGEFTIKGSINSPDDHLIIEITDMLGQVIFNDRVVVKNSSINYRVNLAETIANGIYLLNVRSGIENVVFHIVIEK